MSTGREGDWRPPTESGESLHDRLTGLPNRILFVDRLEHALARAARAGGPVGVLLIDLDGFRTVNDSLGREAGDRLLVAVGERLSGCLRPGDTVARHAGDEFAVLIEDLREPADAVFAAERVLQALESPFHAAGREVFIGASIGIAAGEGEPETVLRDADLAMDRAKRDGRRRYAVFEESMHADVVERLELEVDLRRAIQRDELALVYQPVFNLRSGAISGFEALVRWRHPTRGMVAPGRFIPLAEESGAIRPLGRWVLRTACHQAALWRARYPTMTDLQVGVNVSGAQLLDSALVDEVAEALETAQLDPIGLTLEITETAVARDVDQAAKTMVGLKELGVDLALDDFGTGYSSLTHLRRFPLDNLKIDRFFIDGVGAPGEDEALLRAIVDLAEIFDLLAVAEGIERPEQRTRLLELNCERGQGNLLAHPLEPAVADALLFKVGLLGGDVSQESTEFVVEDEARADET